MSRTVHCRKYQKALPGLARPPYPGARGQDIFEHVSQQAWDEWQTQQTMLINERRLSMLSAADRKFLQEEMDKFFAGEEHAAAEGFTPRGD